MILLISLIISLAVADDCSVIEEILTQNNLEITWNSSNSTGCCDYEGINCINGRVNQINFSDKGLTGNIESVMSLTSLQYINLSSCKFEGSIPSSIQYIYNLQYIYLGGNNINGTIPREIDIPTLQYLDLSSNQLEGEIPSFTKSINIQSIDLSNNKLSGHVPSSYQNLKNIQTLRLANNKLCGEIPHLTSTLKYCSFGSTLLCVSGPREHCTQGIKDCNTVSCDGEVTTTTSEVPASTNTPEQLTSEDYSQEPDNNNPWNKDNIMKWIAFGLILISILCVIVLILICMKRRFQEPVILEKPLPARKSNTIFGDDLASINDEEQDPDASIQIHTLTKPEQVVPVVSDGVSHSQGSSYDESSQYEVESSYPGSVVSNNYPINPGRTSIIAPIYNQGSFYATNSLGRNQTHQNGHYTTYSLGRNPTSYPFAQIPVKTLEQDLGELVIDNNGNVVTDNPHITASTTTIGNTSPVVPSSPSKKFSTSIFGYSHSQSSPNLVRMSHYSQPSNNKRRMTYSTTAQGADNSANSSPNIESRRSKHASIPYLVSSYSKKSPNINNRKSYDIKRRSFEEGALHHNTIHVVNSRKSIPYTVEKSPTTITKVTNYSENTVASNATNSVHSATQLVNKNKNRASVHSVKPKRSSGVLSKYSQNSINGSPLVTSIENCDLNPAEAEGVNLYHVNNKSKSTLNPSIVSSSNTSIHSQSNHDSNDDNDNNENVNTNTNVNANTNVNENNDKIVNETQTEATTTNEHDSTPSTSNSSSIDYQDNSSQSNDDHDQNSQLDTPASIRNDNVYSNVNTNVTTPLENTENPSEEIYIEDSTDEEKDMLKKEEHSLSKELYRQDALEEGYEYDYEYENLPDEIREQIEQQQPPNYEEVFSESVYTPYIDSNNDEAIRMQLEMRRLEERQLRMEYLQRQIDNPEISDAQRQKYIDALDRLMLE